MEVLRLKRNNEERITNVVVSIFPSEKKADEMTAKMNKNMLNRSRYSKRVLQKKNRLKKK